MNLARSYRIRDGIVSRKVGDETVVVRIDGPEVIVLNGTAGSILNLVGEGLSGDQIVERLLSEYEVSRDQLAGTVEAFMAELEAGALVEAVAA